jgi:hypothetical protein
MVVVGPMPFFHPGNASVGLAWFLYEIALKIQVCLLHEHISKILV